MKCVTLYMLVTVVCDVFIYDWRNVILSHMFTMKANSSVAPLLQSFVALWFALFSTLPGKTSISLSHFLSINFFVALRKGRNYSYLYLVTSKNNFSFYTALKVQPSTKKLAKTSFQIVENSVLLITNNHFHMVNWWHI